MKKLVLAILGILAVGAGINFYFKHKSYNSSLKYSKFSRQREDLQFSALNPKNISDKEDLQKRVKKLDEALGNSPRQGRLEMLLKKSQPLSAEDIKYYKSRIDLSDTDKKDAVAELAEALGNDARGQLGLDLYLNKVNVLFETESVVKQAEIYAGLMDDPEQAREILTDILQRIPTELKNARAETLNIIKTLDLSSEFKRDLALNELYSESITLSQASLDEYENDKLYSEHILLGDSYRMFLLNTNNEQDAFDKTIDIINKSTDPSSKKIILYNYSVVYPEKLSALEERLK